MTAESAENMPLTPSECIDDYQNKCSIHSLSILQPECYKENVGMYREIEKSEFSIFVCNGLPFGSIALQIKELKAREPISPEKLTFVAVIRTNETSSR